MKQRLIFLLFLLGLLQPFTVAAQPYYNTCIQLHVLPTDSGIALTWDANTGMQNFLRYEVQQQTTAEAFADQFTTIGTTQSLSATSFSVSGLSVGTTYYFRILVIDTSQNISCYSNVESGYFSGSTVRPPSRLRVFNFSSNGDLSFRWHKGSSSIQKYRILADTIPQPSTVVDSTLAYTDTFKIITGFDTLLNYFFRIQALDSTGAVVGYSDEVIHKPGLQMPPFASQLTSTFSGGNVTLSWVPNTSLQGFKRYLVYRGASPTNLVPFYYTQRGNRSDTNLVLTNLGNSTYYYSVTSQNIAGLNTATDSVVQVVFQDTFPPSVPQKFTATAGDQNAFLKWNRSTDQHGNFFRYKIYLDTQNPPQTLVSTNNTINDTTEVITGLQNGVTYFVAVSAEDSYNNESSLSTTDTVVPADTTGPEAVSNFTVEIDSARVPMTWTPSANSAGDFWFYRILRGSSFQTLQPIDTIFNYLSTGYNDNDVVNGTTYFYKVECIDSLGNTSANSPKFRITPSNVEKEPNNFFFSGTTLEEKSVGEIANSSDIDYFKFTITQPTQIAVETDAIASLDTLVGSNIQDTYLILYDSTGNNQIAFNNNNPNNNNYSRIVQYLSNPGTYYLSVDGNLASDIGYYEITLDKLQPDIYEPNNSIFTANMITQDTVSVPNISIFPLGDVDVLGFQSGQSYKAEITVNNPLYTGTLRFIDSTNQVLQTINANSATFITPDSATYFISYQVSGFVVPNYSLDFRLIPPVSYADSFQISEVNYKEAEFIEIFNKHTNAIDVSGFEIQEVNYQFPTGTVIPGNSFFVVANDSAAFFQQYGFYPELAWKGDTLKHNNQIITLNDSANSLVDLLYYRTATGFPSASAGINRTLELVDPFSNNNVGGNWQVSHFDGGTPGHKASLSRIYSPDGFEANNVDSAAVNIDYIDTIAFSMAEIEDQADWFYWRPQAQDTLSLSFDRIDSTLSTEVSFYDKNLVLWFSDTLSQGYDTTLVPQWEDTLFMKVSLLNDGLPFIINEGFGSFSIGLKQYISQSKWSEDFEAEQHPYLPPGYRVFDLDSNGSRWQVSSITIGKGNTKGLELNKNPNGNNDWIILPPFNIRQDDSFGFYGKPSSTNIPEKVEIWIGDRGDIHPNQFQTLVDTFTFDSAGFQLFKVDLSAYDQEVKRVAIRSVSVNKNQLYLDDLSLAPPDFDASIRGTITDILSGNPIAGVKVTDGKKSVFSDTSGYYEINEVRFGNVPIEFTAPSYTSAVNTFSLSQGDTILFDVSLVPNLIDTFYINTFDGGTTQGTSSNSTGTRNWVTLDTIVFGGSAIYPIQGDSMLAFGSSVGYGIDQTAGYNFLTSGSFDFSQYEKIDLYYSVNHNIDTSDGAFLIGNFNTIIDINEDGFLDSNDVYTGNSNGWFRDTVSLTNYTNFSNFDLSFFFLSNTYFNSGFGIAIDDIMMIGEREVEKPAPFGLQAESFLIDTVKLKWNIDTNNVTNYKIFRSTLNEPYTLIATTADTQFLDTNIQNGSLYNYYVIATYPFGESEASDNALATPGIPNTLSVPYSINFNQTLADTLPYLWGYDLSLQNPWFVGDTLLAQSFNNQFSLPSRFVFASFFSMGVIGVYYETMLTTPWFDFTGLTERIVLQFTQQSAPVEETHELIYRDALGSDWIVLDTLDGNWNPRNYNYDITAIAKGKTFFQFAFRLRNDSSTVNTPLVGMAIDNFRIREEKEGIIKGVVTSETGSPLPNHPVLIEVGNNQLWDRKKSHVFYTDSSGLYASDSSFTIYDNIRYSVSTGAWNHDSVQVDNLQLFGADTLTQDLTLQLQLNAPEIIATQTDSFGYPIIEWRAPDKVGEISYDNGVFNSSDSLVQGASGGILFVTNAQLPARIEQIAVYGSGGASSNTFTARGFKVGVNGLPNLTDTLFEASGLHLDSTQMAWNFVSLGVQIDTTHFFLVLTGESGPPSTAVKVGYTKNASQTQSVWQNTPANTYYNKPQGMMLRAYLNVGNTNFNYQSINYPGTYSVYNVTNNSPAIQLLDTNLSQTTFSDTTLQLGDTAFYFVRATGQYGLSPISNLFPFVMQGLPYASLTISNLDLSFAYTTPILSNNILVKNSGLDTLDYTLSYHPGISDSYQVDTPATSNGIEASQIYCFDNPAPGDTATLTFFIENRNLIGDNHEQVEVFFPKGVSVLSSNNLSVFGSSRFLLSGNQTGDSVTVRWSDPNANPIGELFAFEAGKFEVEVAVDSTASFPIQLDYLIVGDSKQQKQGSIELGPLPFSVNVYGGQANLAPGGQGSTGATFSIQNPPLFGGRYPGYFTFSSNDPNKSSEEIPFLIAIDAATGVFNGLVTDDVNNDPIPNAIVTVEGKSDTTDASGWFEIPNISVGTYTFYGNHPYFYEGTTTGTLLSQNDTSTVLISMVPRVQPPVNLKANGAINNIELNWEVEDYKEFFDMEQPTGNLPFEIEGWKTVDQDGDGISWEYYGVGPYQGSYCIANTANNTNQNNDWLISKKIRVEEKNAKLRFYASPQDPNFSEERFVVWASQTGDNVTDFTDSLYSYKFPTGSGAWQLFEIPLKNYNGDSIHLAIQCRSNNQFKLKLDAIEFYSARDIQNPLDTGAYHFNVYRSKNNGLLSYYDNLTSLNDTVQYLDTNTLNDTLYTYFIRSVIPAINQVSEASNFASYRLLSKDLGVVSLISPKTSRNLTDKEVVEVEIENLGTDSITPLDTFSVSYQVNSLPISQMQIIPDSTFGPTESITVAFSDTADLSAKGFYDIKVWSSLARDNNVQNDTLATTIQHKPDTLLPPPWNVNPFNFQYNMSLTAEVDILDTLTTDTNDILAAVVNQQIRGLANIEYIPAFNRYVAQLTIYSNATIENINFMIWDATRDSIFDIIESYTFINNQIYGSLSSPEQLHTISPNELGDIGVEAILSPEVSAASYSNSEALKVRIRNYGTNDLLVGDTIPIHAIVERKGVNLVDVTENVVLTNPLPVNDTLSFIFSQTVNMTDTGTYNFTFYTDYFGDVDRTNDTIRMQIENIPRNEPSWSVNPNQFQYSAFLTGRLFFDDILSQDENDKVAAFVNNQVRGVVEVTFVPSFNGYFVQIPIYSNSPSGDIVKFKAYDHSKDEVLNVEEEYLFLSNEVWGSLVNPERLHAVTGYNSVEWLNAARDFSIYPNPASTNLNISWKNQSPSAIWLLDPLGRTVAFHTISAEYLQMEVNDLPNGVYVLRIATEEGVLDFKVVVSH